MQVCPFGKQVRPQRPPSCTCCCFSRALHQANSDTCLLRSHVKAAAKSSGEHDRRPGLQKVLPCPDQQQDGVCRFPTGHRRQLFSECESSKCCGWDRAKSYKVSRLYSLRRALPCLPYLSCLSLHLHRLLSAPSYTSFCLPHQPVTGQGNTQGGNAKQETTGIPWSPFHDPVVPPNTLLCSRTPNLRLCTQVHH